MDWEKSYMMISHTMIRYLWKNEEIQKEIWEGNQNKEKSATACSGQDPVSYYATITEFIRLEKTDPKAC